MKKKATPAEAAAVGQRQGIPAVLHRHVRGPW